jgi:hypothetical protein
MDTPLDTQNNPSLTQLCQSENGNSGTITTNPSLSTDLQQVLTAGNSQNNAETTEKRQSVIQRLEKLITSAPSSYFLYTKAYSLPVNCPAENLPSELFSKLMELGARDFDFYIDSMTSMIAIGHAPMGTTPKKSAHARRYEPVATADQGRAATTEAATTDQDIGTTDQDRAATTEVITTDQDIGALTTEAATTDLEDGGNTDQDIGAATTEAATTDHDDGGTTYQENGNASRNDQHEARPKPDDHVQMGEKDTDLTTAEQPSAQVQQATAKENGHRRRISQIGKVSFTGQSSNGTSQKKASTPEVQGGANVSLPTESEVVDIIQMLSRMADASPLTSPSRAQSTEFQLTNALQENDVSASSYKFSEYSGQSLEESAPKLRSDEVYSTRRRSSQSKLAAQPTEDDGNLSPFAVITKRIIKARRKFPIRTFY